MAKARKWFVVQTNIKCEDRAAKSLRAERFRVYVPKMRKTIVHHRTKELLDRRFKLFNRYIFVGIAADDLAFGLVRSCDGVYDILGSRMDGKPWEVPRETIARIMRAQRSGQFDSLIKRYNITALKGEFPKGSNVKVRDRYGHHPFGGFYGQVEKVKGKGTVRIMLEMFGTLVPVDFSADDLERVDRMDDAA